MTTRNLQITIFEAPPDRRRGGGRGAGFDPEETYVKPPPEDPEETYVKPPPEDPEESYVKPPPEDPEETYVKPPPEDPWSRYGGAHPGYAASQGPLVSARYLPATAPAQPCCCTPCSEDRGRAPEHPCVGLRDYSGFVIVRLAEGVGPLAVESLWELAEEAGLEGLRSVLAMPLVDEPAPEERPPASLAWEEPAREGLAWEPAAGEEEGEEGEDRERPRRERPRGKDYRWAVSLARWLWERWRRESKDRRSPEPEGLLVSRPLIQLRDRDRESTLHAIRGSEDQASRTRFRPRHGLARYWRVDLRPHPELLADVLDRFNDLAEVDLAYREVRALDTAYHEGSRTGGDLAEDQGYFDAAPAGIGAAWVKEHLAAAGPGETGPDRQARLAIIDLEQGWTVDHLELEQSLKAATLLVHGENRQDDEPGAGNHGTAVLGQLAAAGVGDLRVQGSATEIADFQLASHYRRQGESTRENPFPGTNGHVASAIVNCLIGTPGDPSPLGTGDVLLLEVQRGRLPTEIDEADLDAIRLATALGVIVIEAAGNGSFDLDRCGDPQTGRSLQRGAPSFVDSGAILVGAAFSELPHDRAPFSNYGSRIDCYGWGEGVTTCGYGDLYDGGGNRDQYYTNTFNGTSSAAPIIAGAAALVQHLHQLRTQNRLLPVPMRALLSNRATGTPQGPNVGGHVGVMPDLHAIVREQLQLVPDVYARRHAGDDGSRLGPGDEIGSSPDVVLLDAKAPPQELGEAGRGAHHPAPGETRTDGGNLYVRLRNRGLAPSSAGVLLYASPAATLISPDAWTHVGSVILDEVPPGDTLRVSPALAWRPAGFEVPQPDWPGGAVRAYSFLAVFDPQGGAPPAPARALPPGPPYYDWASHRRFLRGPGVAWRNLHPIAPGTEASLAFFLAGTPDRAREQDLEVIQRLPAGAQVRLHLPQGLAAVLRQRQPALGPSGPGPLSLPRRRSTRFGRVRLPRRLRAPGWFEVTTAGEPLAEGHSLAIRQLWRGEEVGRITWYVTG